MKTRLAALDRFAPRRVLMITIIVATVMMGDSMIYNVLPSNVNAFGVAVGLVGVLLSANRFVRLASNPLAAYLLERFGASRPLMASIIVALGSTVMLGLAKGFALLLLARLLWGVSFSILRLAGYLVVLEEAEDGRRGRLMGVFSGGIRVGSMVAVLLGGILFDMLGRGPSFVIIAAVGLLSIPAFLALVPGLKQGNGVEAETEGVAHQKEEALSSQSVGQRLWNQVVPSVPGMDAGQRNKLLAAYFTTFAFYLVMGGVLISTLGFYLRERLGDEVAIAGVAIGIATLNGLLLSVRLMTDVAGPFLGYLGDRIGHERIPVVAIPTCVAALFLMGFNAPALWAFVWLPVAFLGVTAAMISLNAAVGGMAPVHRRPQVMSRLASWQDLGFASGPLLAYAALGSVSLTIIYVVGAGILLTALASQTFASVRHRTREGR